MKFFILAQHIAVLPSYQSSKLPYCSRYGIEGVFNTSWNFSSDSDKGQYCFISLYITSYSLLGTNALASPTRGASAALALSYFKVLPSPCTKCPLTISPNI